jgi:transposase
MPDERVKIIVGVDTHADSHTAVALDEVGRRLDTVQIGADETGYRRLCDWAGDLGELGVVGIEGTGSYGAGLARFMSDAGIEVIEVGRPNRQHRRRHGKSDPADAEGAARAVLAGEATAVPKSRDGIVESIRALHLVKRSAIKARTQAANQMTALVLTAPEATRAELRGLTPLKRARSAAAWRPGSSSDPATVTRRAIRALARRWLDLNTEIKTHNAELDELTRTAAPGLVAQQGVSRDVAAKLLIAAGDNPERIRTEAGFAALCGVSPIRASSGKTNRHRLNRSGDRQANNALWTIARVRLTHDPETRAYAQRREHQGLSHREIVRCLKRYLARRLYPILLADLAKLT